MYIIYTYLGNKENIMYKKNFKKMIHKEIKFIVLNSKTSDQS